MAQKHWKDEPESQDFPAVQSYLSLVMAPSARGGPLAIADGYHRVCAGYHLGENADIPCRIVDRP